MTDIQKLKVLAEAATPGRVHDRLDSCGGGLKYECFGDDGSLVLKVDHKNDDWGFVGDRGEQDEAFFLACTPAAVLKLITEVERLEERNVYWIDQANTIARDRNTLRAERDQLKAENESLRQQLAVPSDVLADAEALRAENEALKANASLIDVLPHLDEALEDLEIHGQHSDQGYRKLKDWYRKIALACKAIDGAMSKESGHD